jgi:hypothetical protein
MPKTSKTPAPVITEITAIMEKYLDQKEELEKKISAMIDHPSYHARKEAFAVIVSRNMKIPKRQDC